MSTSRVLAGAGLRPLLFSILVSLAAFAAAAALASVAAEAAEEATAGKPAEVGLWQTISDKTGKPEGYVRIQLVGDELRGVIERGMPGDDPNELCTKCPGERKNQRKLGMTIITGLHRDPKSEWWIGGRVLDVNEGNVYRCKMRVIDDGRKLVLRGYLLFDTALSGRSQTWLRQE